MKSTALRQILAHDIPALPEHWHEECDCVPTLAYLRVSKVMNREKIVSPTIQLNEIIADARRKGRRIVKILIDINKSGKDFDRKAFGEAVEDIKAGVYKHISVWKWNRFGRTMLGSMTMLKMLEEVDASVSSATESFEYESAIGEFNLNGLLNMAQMQSRTLGETWRGVHTARKQNQLPHTGQKRFGYDYITDDVRNKRYEINEEEARILRWSYEQYVAGKSMKWIVAEVNAQGFTTPYGNAWTRHTFTRTLESGFAAGQFRQRSKAAKKAQKRRRDNTRAAFDEWEKGKHTPIIDMALWRAYEKIRDEGAALPPNRSTHALSTLLVCGLCARRLTTRYTGQNRQHRWVCDGRARYHPERPLTISNVDALSVVRQWAEARSKPEWLEAEIQRMHEAEDSARPEVDRIEAELKKTSAKAAKALRLYLDTDDDNEESRTRVLSAMNALDARVADLKRQRAELVVGRVAPDWAALGSLSETWDLDEPQTHNAALRAALGMVVVFPPVDPKVRRDVSRVTVVPAWEMEEWSDWLAARRQRSL